MDSKQKKYRQKKNRKQLKLVDQCSESFDEKDDENETTEFETQKSDTKSHYSLGDSQSLAISLNKRIHKEKPKATIYGFKMILKSATSDLSEQQQNVEQIIYRQVPIQRAYLAAGDILVELKGSNDCMINQIYNEFRNITSVEKYKNAVLFSVESSKQVKYLTEIIYYLENSQDQKSHEFAQQLKCHQQVVFMIQDQISQLKSNYISSCFDFSQLIIDRRNYVQQQKKLIIAQQLDQDDFASFGTLQISFTGSTISLTNLAITKPVIALLGVEQEDLAQMLLRKGFTKIYNQYSRRFISMTSMQFQLKRQNDLTIDIPQFEFCTFDDIKLVCQCIIKSIQIVFPPHLQFQGDNVDILNNAEQFIHIKLVITPQHISQILNIRSQYSQPSPQNQEFPQNYQYKNNIDIENFEYNIQSQIFLEKYYQDMLDKMKKEEEEKEREAQEEILKQQQKEAQLYCGYKYIV